MPRTRLPISLLAALAAAVLLAPPAASAGAREAATLRNINQARVAAGVPKVHRYMPLTRSSKRYATRLARSGTFSHSANPARGARVGYVGEILGMSSTPTGAPGSLVQAWLASPVHRPILLDPRYRYVGIGIRRGSSGWVWVVRLGAR
jgi:uncharacterized protein YkwD